MTTDSTPAQPTYEENPVRYVCDECDSLEEHYGSDWFTGNTLNDE